MSQHLNGFPTADELGRRSVLGGLSSLIKLMNLVTKYGQTSVITKDEEEVRLVFHNMTKFEAMGYKVTFEYDDELAESYEFEDLVAEDMVSAKLDWSHKVFTKY